MSQVELNGELFTLERFPPNAEEEALQAWEAADEYLLQQVNDVDGLTLIFNDGFGALSCALAERNPGQHQRLLYFRAGDPPQPADERYR
ncbi:23S rRNA (guanine-N-2-)-methyltransferase rlmG (plasmid) [Klebsiella aerogenes]|nr:23S rRNA (guanine-N-2-)-methyltransferase rlmG [Klebsiella aerogenes]